MESLASLSWSCNADLSWSQVQLEQIWALPSGASGGGCYGGPEEGSELEMEGIWQLQAASNRSLAGQAVWNLRHASVPFKHLQVTALERWRAPSCRAWNSLVSQGLQPIPKGDTLTSDGEPVLEQPGRENLVRSISEFKVIHTFLRPPIKTMSDPHIWILKVIWRF